MVWHKRRKTCTEELLAIFKLSLEDMFGDDLIGWIGDSDCASEALQPSELATY
jgi:hypothetical protein